MGHSILFRCDGSREIGFGHIVRCLALADELREEHGCGVVFALLCDAAGIGYIMDKGYRVISPDPAGNTFDYHAWLRKIAIENNIKALVLDVRDDLPVEAIKDLKRDGVLIVTIDDPTERRLAADFAFYPPVPLVKRMNWTGFSGALYAGWEWVILRRQFSQFDNGQNKTSEARQNRDNNTVPVVLVTMGGSDPMGMTLQAMKALNRIKTNLKVSIIVGPEFAFEEKLGEFLSLSPHHYEIHRNVSNMAEVMASADIAVASFGVTAYELAATGVPAIYLCLTEDHADSASIFEKNNMAFSLGVFGTVSDAEFCEKIEYLLSNERFRAHMAKQAKSLVDGKGAMRIATKIRMELDHGENSNVEWP